MGYPYSHASEVSIISKHFGDPDARTLEGWKKRGGYEGLQKALQMGPEEVIGLVKDSGLRGRGGAGFPTGLKWSFMPKDSKKPHYLLCNADESEPGTFKDRELLRWAPHQLIEGCAIGAYAIGAEQIYIYCRGEFFEANQVLAKAVEDAYEAGILGQDVFGSGKRIELTVHAGAGAYICGEETGLMNSLEGRRGEPRIKPPFPAAAGLFGLPTTINNVETLSAIPHIVAKGSDWYRKWGTEDSPGTKLFCVSGHVKRPGNYELPLGFPLKELIDEVCGGVVDGNALKAVIPGGSSVPILSAKQVENCLLSYEGVEEAGSMLGCASVIVMDETTDVVHQVMRMSSFYAHESCGQCTPCREGTAWVTNILKKLLAGKGNEEDLDTLMELTDQMTGTTICVLSDSVAAPVQSSIKYFREDYQKLIKEGEADG